VYIFSLLKYLATLKVKISQQLTQRSSHDWTVPLREISEWKVSHLFYMRCFPCNDASLIVVPGILKLYWWFFCALILKMTFVLHWCNLSLFVFPLLSVFSVSFFLLCVLFVFLLFLSLFLYVSSLVWCEVLASIMVASSLCFWPCNRNQFAG